MKHILIAVDFSPHTEAFLQQVIRLGNPLDAQLQLIHVTSPHTQAVTYDPFPYYDMPEGSMAPAMDVHLARDLCAEEYRREHQRLLAIAHHLREEGAQAQALLVKGGPAERILEKAAQTPYDLIILGSHGHSTLRKALLGSVSEAILRKAPCPVMIIPTPLK